MKKKTPATTPAGSEQCDAKQAIAQLEQCVEHKQVVLQHFQIPPGDYVIVPRAHYEECFRCWKNVHHADHYSSPASQVRKAVLERPQPPTEEQVKIELNRLQADFPELGEFIKQVHAEVEAKKKGKHEPTDKPEGTQGS